MQAVEVQDKLVEVPSGQREASEALKRVRKLRWIGMDHEAEKLQMTLLGIVVDAAADTD